MSRWEHYTIKRINDRYLYRFVSETNLEKFLKTGHLWMSRADTFGDKMECVTINDLRLKRPPIHDIEKRKQKHLISCWHLATNESLAMWDSYVSEITKRRTVAIRFERKKLIDIVTNSVANNLPKYTAKTILGPVRYKNLLRNSSELADSDKVKYVAFRKEYDFNYENEFRFVIQHKKEYHDKGYNYYLGNPQDLPFQILINPLLDKADYIKTKEQITKGKFKNNFNESSLTKWLKPELW
jgi:hypothetical protein